MTLAAGHSIGVVRGRREERTDRELIDFWTGHGVLSEPVALARLEHVVCVLRDAEGQIAAVNSVFEQAVPMLGGCRLWAYRTFAPGSEAQDAAEEMVAAARQRLEEDFDPDAPGPIGIFRLVADRELLAARREPVWPTSGLMFAGYTASGEQLRVVYFEGAKVT